MTNKALLKAKIVSLSHELEILSEGDFAQSLSIKLNKLEPSQNKGNYYKKV